MDYGFTHEGKAYTPKRTKVSVEENEARNKDIEAQGLAHWASRLQTWAGYVIDNNAVTTWLGTKIGTIYWGRISQGLNGERIRHIHVQGSNGASYWGKYGSDWSQLVD